ncbi:MAG: hypothetical protein ACR2LL_00765 [Nitrosopumilus sp.]
MSSKTNYDSSRASMLAEVKKMQEELNELKKIKKEIEIKLTEEKPVKKTSMPKKKGTKKKVGRTKKSTKKQKK